MIIKISIRNYDSDRHPPTTRYEIEESQSEFMHCLLKQNSTWTQ